MIQSRETIQFALGACSLGSILVAASGIGVCAIALGDCPSELLKEFQTQFSNATLLKGDDDLDDYVAQVVGLVAAYHALVDNRNWFMVLVLAVPLTVLLFDRWQELRPLFSPTRAEQ